MKQGISCLFLALPLLLASCLGIDADARIGADGAVDLNLTYTVSTALDELGKLGANAEYLPVPVGRDDLQLAAQRAGGELRSWSRKDGAESFVVTSALRFPTAAAFASFIDPAGKLASYSEAGGRATLSMTLSEGTPPADKDLIEFIQVAFSEYAISVRISVPRNPSASTGFTVTGRNASFSMKAAELFGSPAPVAVSVSW
ncbi:MAG: hypothetical protein A2Y38_12535 [Spirochaetes bacterium GWB1_59_5]|nr:MAG: hypothetical protein A2Y38_12535 [Spirochaetes bacterium GWB1_59_5]